MAGDFVVECEQPTFYAGWTHYPLKIPESGFTIISLEHGFGRYGPYDQHASDPDLMLCSYFWWEQIEEEAETL